MRHFDLNLLRSSSLGQTMLRYRLGWADAEQHERCLSAWREQAVPPIDWFYIELTSHCNLSCPFCPSQSLQRPRTSMTVDHARILFRKIGDYVCRRDSAWGYTRVDRMVFLHVMGEPLLHPHLVECVQLAREAGLVPALFTNATLLNSKNRKKIFEARLSHLTISLNVIDQAGYSAIGAKDDIASQEGRVIDLLRERSQRGAQGLHIDLQYIIASGREVIGPGLIESRRDVWEKYRKWLLLLREFKHPSGNSPDRRPVVNINALANPLAIDQTETSLRLPLDAGIDFVLKSGCSFGNATVAAGMRVASTTTGRCPFGNPWRQLAVYADGSASFCNLDHENSVNLGNLLSQSIEEIWGGERMQRIRNEMAVGHLAEPLCQRCLGSIVPLSGPAAVNH